jgi:predicted nucleic acid-binding protein
MDTDPIVALYDTRDAWHGWATERAANLSGPAVTCDPVVTENCFLLARASTDPTCILRAVAAVDLKIRDSIGRLPQARRLILTGSLAGLFRRARLWPVPECAPLPSDSH